MVQKFIGKSSIATLRPIQDEGMGPENKDSARIDVHPQ